MARIFIAIRFDDEFKKTLVALQQTLRAKGVAGNYCSYGNLHMTLAFIGESVSVKPNEQNNAYYDSVMARERRMRAVDVLPEIHKAVSEVEFEPFTITLGKLGTFSTKNGVIWCGIKESEPITTIANKLRERLSANGISYSTMAFSPHISLVQHPTQIITDIEVPEVSIKVERIFVMKSERINGELIYSELKDVGLLILHKKL